MTIASVVDHHPSKAVVAPDLAVVSECGDLGDIMCAARVEQRDKRAADGTCVVERSVGLYWRCSRVALYQRNRGQLNTGRKVRAIQAL